MKMIQYRIYLEQPLLATALQGDPNSSVSFNYVPGSQIRGLLIHRYIERNNLRGTDVAGDADGRRLFFDGSTRYLNAYPLTHTLQRSLPTPLALLKRRSHELEQSYNASHAEWDDEARHNAEGNDQLNNLDQPFCWQNDDGSITLYTLPPNTISIHVLRERPKGRATPDQGAVFQYDALSKGQWFAGIILADVDTDAPTIRGLLAPSIGWLGRSRSAEYGRVHIEALPERAGVWREAGGVVPTGLDSHATVTLLSDTVLRDSAGNIAVTLTDAILSAYLGARVAIKSPHTFSATTTHGGFNRTWQMPLVQTWALRAGSVIAFEPQEPIDIRRLEQQGIGERRAEGFGRIAFDWLTEMKITASLGEGYQPTSQYNKSDQLTPVARTLAQRMAKQLLATQIEQGILIFTRDKALANPPRNSQLGRVRVLIRRAMREEYKLAIVRDGMQSFKDTAHQQFQSARIEGRSLWEWLSGMLAEPANDANGKALPSYEDVWEKIKQIDAPWPSVAGEPAQRDTQLSRATALRLIDAVLASAARTSKRSTAEVTNSSEEARV